VRFSDIPRGSAQRTGMRPFAAGLIAVLVVGLGTFFAFTKANPFASPYELEAVFANANRVAERSPVRIAGVNVGEVTSVEAVEKGTGYARVKMEISDEGLPIHQDAQLKVRSRLFLEGNYFVELRPGTPGEPELASVGRELSVVACIAKPCSADDLRRALARLDEERRRRAKRREAG